MLEKKNVATLPWLNEFFSFSLFLYRILTTFTEKEEKIHFIDPKFFQMVSLLCFRNFARTMATFAWVVGVGGVANSHLKFHSGRTMPCQEKAKIKTENGLHQVISQKMSFAFSFSTLSSAFYQSRINESFRVNCA
jgi:hypothetical protein